MVEIELDNIKNKLKDDKFDLEDCEKKLGKIEKNLIKLENKFNLSNNNYNTINCNTDSDSDSECDINIDVILRDLEKLNIELTNINTSIPIEKLIENYIQFKIKLSSIKSKNEDFKLKSEYL
jgi:hypothetical protein